jgi:PAB-dependent poly(A)-specific ribonuclease subunit 2
MWAGSALGRVSSFYGTDLTRYTSFKAGDGEIKQLLMHDRGVIALSARSVHMALRRGPPIWHIQYGPNHPMILS